MRAKATDNSPSTMLASRICDVVEHWAAYSPYQLALAEPGGSWNYHELNSIVDSTCKWLVLAGVRPGDRVVLVSENGRAFVALFLALTQLNAWPVLLNARIASQEIDQIRDHCGARLVIFLVASSPHALKHANRHGAEIQNVEDIGQIAVGSLNELTAPEPVAPLSENQVAALIYTSGTTGLPKGVMLTNRNLLFMASHSAEIRCIIPGDRLAGILPMTHAVGLSVILLGTLFAGATLFLWPRFDPVRLLTSLEKDNLSVLLGTPSMFAMICEYAGRKGLKRLHYPRLRIISSSGAPLQMSIKIEAENLFGMPLHNGYGVTECSPTIALTRVESPRKDTAVGKVFPGVEVKLVHPGNDLVGDGEIGELRVRGPNVMKGYYRSPGETAEAIDQDGWFNTRDLAQMDGEHLFIVGRTKELIVRFGFNVYPAEVEAVLNSFPGVMRSAVIGRSLKGTGDEEIIAFVQLQPNSGATVDELAKYAGQHLAAYKQPSEIYLVAQMPLTPTGKVKKDTLARSVGVEPSKS
ncbi:MAG: AMP-binding protein [Candidatus Acidiferrum sp.]